jgi:hypothetical protein
MRSLLCLSPLVFSLLTGCGRPPKGSGSCTASLGADDVGLQLRQPRNVAAGGFIETLGYKTTSGLAQAAKSGEKPYQKLSAAYFDFFVENGKVRVLPISPYGNGIPGAEKIWALVYTIEGKYVRIPLVYGSLARKKAAVERLKHWDVGSLKAFFNRFDYAAEQDTTYPEDLVSQYRCGRAPEAVETAEGDPKTIKFCETPKLRTVPILDVDPKASPDIQELARSLALWQEAERARVEISPSLRAKLEQLRQLRFTVARAVSMEESGFPFYDDQLCQRDSVKKAAPSLCANLELAKEVRARYTLEKGNINDRRPSVGSTVDEFQTRRDQRLDALTREFIALTLKTSQQAWDEGASLRLAANWLYDNRYIKPEQRSRNSIGYHALDIRSYYPVFEGWDYMVFNHGLLYQSMQFENDVRNANLWYDSYGNSVMLVGNAWPLYARIHLRKGNSGDGVLQPLPTTDVPQNPDWVRPEPDVRQPMGKGPGRPPNPKQGSTTPYQPPTWDPPPTQPQPAQPQPQPQPTPRIYPTFSAPVVPTPAGDTSVSPGETEQKRNWSEQQPEPGSGKMIRRAGCN